MIETITAMAAMIGVLDGFTTEGKPNMLPVSRRPKEKTVGPSVPFFNPLFRDENLG
jgi:hypothetical protein